MVLLPICDTKRELNNTTLVLLNRVVGEAACKRKEIEGGGMYCEDFASLLSSRLESAGIAFKFVWFDYRL